MTNLNLFCRSALVRRGLSENSGRKDACPDRHNEANHAADHNHTIAETARLRRPPHVQAMPAPAQFTIARAILDSERGLSTTFAVIVWTGKVDSTSAQRAIQIGPQILDGLDTHA